jgi:ketosteroid isomerase-like protein
MRPMRTRLLAAMLATTVWLPAAESDVIQQVIEASKRFQRAGTSKDHAGELKDLFDENVTHFHPGGPYRLVGRDRLVREFSEALSRSEDFIFEMVEPKVQVISDNAAVLTYYISESFTERGTRKNVSEKATEVWVRGTGQAWKMIHGHYSNP